MWLLGAPTPGYETDRYISTAYLTFGNASLQWETHVDFNFDGVVDTSDSLELLRVVVGKSILVARPSQGDDHSHSPSPVTISAPTNETGCRMQAAVSVFLPAGTLPFCAAVGGPSISNSKTAPLFVKMAQSLDLRCVLISDPGTFGAGAKTRLESRIKKFTPHCVCRPRLPRRRLHRGWYCAFVPPYAQDCGLS